MIFNKKPPLPGASAIGEGGLRLPQGFRGRPTASLNHKRATSQGPEPKSGAMGLPSPDNTFTTFNLIMLLEHTKIIYS